MISPLGTVQESYTAFFTFTSMAMTGFKFLPVPSEYGPGIIGVHEVYFTTPYYIPPSKIQTSATQLVSYIKITYTKGTAGASAVPADLGYGFTVPTEIPCKSLKGLNPVIGTNINCTVYPVTDSPYIIVKNYGEVPVNGQVLILIPHVLNPSSQINFDIKIVNKQNRLLTISSTQTSSFTFTTRTWTGFNSTYTLAGQYNFFTNTSINSDFSVSYQCSMYSVYSASSKFIFKVPNYDVGLVPEEGHVTCSIGGQAFSCWQFGKGLNWIYGSFSADQTQTVNITHPWVLSNLRWPRSETTATLEKNVVWTYQVSSGKYLTKEALHYPTFASPVHNDFIRTGLNVDKKWRKQVDVTYTFTFICMDDIPDGGTLILTLPSQYNLVASFPAVQVILPEFSDYSSTKKLTTLVTANTVTVYNIKRVYKKNEFRVILKGMRNPDVAASMNGFFVRTELNGQLVNKKDNFITVLLENSTSTYIPNKIDLNPITVFPINRQVDADYTFVFIPSTKLSPGAEIHIKFPPEYSSLPQNPYCNVWGGINTFEVCYKLANEIILKLDSSYNTNYIYLRIHGITNPNIENTSSFEIYTYYDGSIVDETKASSASNRIVKFSTKPSLLSMREFYFDPINEGEVAKYTISFLPTNSIPTGMNIYIRFPRTFDMRLGRDVGIQVVGGLSGDIKSSLFERVITLSNFNNYDVSYGIPIKVEVDGVINPNKPEAGHSGFISVGTIYPGSNTFLDYLEKAGSVQTTSSPGWLTLNSISSTNYLSRSYADYTIHLTATDSIPKSEYEGSIFVDFPSDYEAYTGSVKCTNITANLGYSIKCTQEKRLIKQVGHPDILTGDVSFDIKSIKNPLDEITTQSFFVRTYDGFTRQILQRSFENLDPYKLNFTYPGPLIIVNDNKDIFCERGTQTKDLYLFSTEIMSLNLTFVPVTPGFTFVPNEIKMYVGEIKSKFRVSVPMGFTEGEYEVEWITKGDLSTPIYTPIRKTKIVITGKGSIPLLISKMNDVPYQGNSLPVVISTDYAPDIGVEVLVSLDKIYPGITLDKQSVQFIAGTNLNTFMVYFSDKSIPIESVVQSGTVNLQLIGVNKDIYSLPTDTLTFNVISQDVRTPEITDIQLTQVTQTSATVQFSCSDIAIAYYMIALKGTAQPPLSEMKTLGPAEYGVFYVGQEQSGILYFEGLAAETEYVVYILLEDRGFNEIQAPGYLEFKTKDRYNAAFVTLKFQQNYINSAERALIAEKMAFLLSLNPWKVEQSKYTYQQLQGRRVLQYRDELNAMITPSQIYHSRVLQTAQETTTSLITFTVLAEPTSPVYPPPTELSSKLNLESKKAKMREAFQNFDSTYEIVPIEFKRYQVGFSTNPVVLGVSYNEVNISCNLDNYGYVYAVAVKKDEDLGKPSSYQISQGLNYRNVPLPSNYVEINQKFVAFNMTVSYLDPDTAYNMYVSAGSAHPGYPDLMNDTLIAFLEFNTDKAPVKPRLNINYSKLAGVSLILLLATLLLFIS